MSSAPWVSFNGKDCSGCKHLNDRGYCEFTACIIPCMVRATIPEAKPQTNADRICAMSDEELAEWIYTHRWNDFDGLLDWLKQEASCDCTST